MKKLFTPLIFGALFYWLYKSYKKDNRTITNIVIDNKFSDRNNFHLIPDGKNNFRSAQLDLNDLQKVIKDYGIKTIIRMNGDGKDTHTGLTVDNERKVCKLNNCEFKYINAHQGYVQNKGYQGSIKIISDYLKKGNTLVHCNWGADRTGFIVAGYLKNNNIITDENKLWEYTTNLNSWNYYIKNGKFEPYKKYAEGFMSPDLLAKKLKK